MIMKQVFITKVKMIAAWKFLPDITESIDKVNVICIIR